ncbi:CLUMA_CG014072, isoform A [Clunio marinus]|uniref:CLUMA_CG014072, isoform A n=1 Tax=Clunio marinus TaxID=568069 RepID=A0A1J1IKQ6_9DIPT|nr:CLUMA_CG014072, isoform A [Clunio marinus]
MKSDPEGYLSIAVIKMKPHNSGSTKLTRKLQTNNYFSSSKPERKEWKCNICHKDFETDAMLREHENIHVTPFCEQCKKMFKSAKFLHLHQLSHHSNQQESKEHKLSSSEEEQLSICEDLTLNKVKEEPIELVSEPEIENLLNQDPQNSSNAIQDTSSRESSCRSADFYSDASKTLGIWRNFTDHPAQSFLEHSSVPMNIKLEPLDAPVESDQFDFIINEILKKPNESSPCSSKLSLVAEEIPLQQNFWTQSENQIQQDQEVWTCDICNRNFSTKQILQRHRIALHDHNKDFKCDQCDMWFSSSNNHELIKHVNEVHNGFKKFICDYHGCNKEFSRRDALKRHRQTHEAQKKKIIMQQASSKLTGVPSTLSTYSCFDCGLNFRYQTALILHLKDHKV